MDPGIRSLVLSRLEADASASGAWSGLVLAALEGQARSRRSCGAAPGHREPTRRERRRRSTAPSCRTIAVEGFRGIGPAADAGAAAGSGPDARRRAQRLRQVELRRGARGAPHRRQPALEGARRRLARGLAQPPPSRGVAQRDVPRRGRARARAWCRAAGSRRRRSKPAAAVAQLHDKPSVRPRLARLDRGPAHPSALPVLQRAGLASRRGALEALRRALLDPGPRGSRRGAGRAPGGAALPREGPQGRDRRARSPARAAARRRRRAGAAGGGRRRRQGVGPGRGRRGARRAPRPRGRARPRSTCSGGSRAWSRPTRRGWRPPSRRCAQRPRPSGPPRRRPRPGPATRRRSSRARSSTTPPTATATARCAAARAPSTAPGARKQRDAAARLREAAREADAVHQRAEAARRQWEGLATLKADAFTRAAEVGLDLGELVEALGSLGQGGIDRRPRRARRPRRVGQRAAAGGGRPPARLRAGRARAQGGRVAAGGGRGRGLAEGRPRGRAPEPPT